MTWHVDGLVVPSQCAPSSDQPFTLQLQQGSHPTARHQHIMASREILLRFIVIGFGDRNPKEWTHKRSVPASLTASFPAETTLAYQQQFREEATKIVTQYQAECEEKAGKVCVACHGRSATPVITPCSYLHIPEEPFINIIIQPTCNAQECRTAAAKVMEDTMGGVDGSNEVNKNICAACGKEGDLKRCSKCKSIGYCGVDCQRRNWKWHKRVCA
ncbi:hypothetical protein BDU57DRAFT_180412 [Ampelomyces quisqualis]|uniref:MYND-type domain-containing protein n=1 Tax=Ampelomyces quisqualis TaxID=50730 RepID=A0A6A5QTH0_AMPQU|nr:hypothetical protein BDU57DRAFT_180412 [Ampelomyces quisqualis]